MPHSLQTLLDGLSSEDPEVRDGWAYAELAEGIDDGRFDNDWAHIRAAALTHLQSPHVHARTFAPLMLTWLIAAGDRDRGSFEAVARWYLHESDTRGHDDRLGWLHAVAHGADYLGECARAGVATGPEVLDLLAARLVGPGPAWRQQEQARVAHAAVLALADCTEEEASGWLNSVGLALDSLADNHMQPATGPPPAWLHNTHTTCTCLYLALSEKPRDGEDPARIEVALAARGALARTASRITPWLVGAQE